MIPQRVLVVCSAMASAGMLWSAVLIAGLLAGTRLVPTGLAVGTAAALSVPGVIVGIVGNRWAYRTTRPRAPWALTSWVPPHVPHWAAMGAGVVFFGFWLAVVLAFAGLDGDTEISDGQYVSTENGRTTVITEAAYDRQADLEQQISLGLLGALAVGGMFTTAAVLTHHAAPQPTVTQSAGQPLA